MCKRRRPLALGATRTVGVNDVQADHPGPGASCPSRIQRAHQNGYCRALHARELERGGAACPSSPPAIATHAQPLRRPALYGGLQQLAPDLGRDSLSRGSKACSSLMRPALTLKSSCHICPCVRSCLLLAAGHDLSATSNNYAITTQRAVLPRAQCKAYIMSVVAFNECPKWRHQSRRCQNNT